MKKTLLFITLLALAACSSEDGGGETFEPQPPAQTVVSENLIICNEGNWQSDNGQLSYYDGNTGKMTNQWFRSKNGIKLGDTPNDILHVNDTLIAIAVNWSNIIQYIHRNGMRRDRERT